ncbi:MAG: ABC transporter permease, partial [Bacteroidales bacterium]|nr:ABC transporter permease [Bacteroidales bacterium]
MASFNIFRRGNSAISSILNVLGMAVAFAAFYIILVQVNYDLNFNRGIKDSEKVFVLSVNAQGEAKYNSLYYCRPLAEMLMHSSPNIEFGGIINLTNTADESFWIERKGRKETLTMNHTDISGTALKAAGFEALEGSLDEVINRNTLAISESAAKKFDLKVGMGLGQGSDIRTIVAIFKDMPDNSHFKNLDLLSNMGDKSLENFTEWGFTHFVKLHDPSQVERMEKELADVSRKYYMEKFFKNMPSPQEMGMTQEEYDKEVNTMLNMAVADFIPLESLYYNNAQLEKGNKTTTYILLIVGILVVGIAFINYINFFFAQIPDR